MVISLSSHNLQEQFTIETLKRYYRMTKPGIIRGNIMTAAAGFFLASKGSYNFALLGWLLAGTSLIIASACVINNYIDRGIDSKMARTKNRALVTGVITAKNALLFASVLGVAGFIILALYTNLLTVTIGIVGMLSYVVLYGYYKRRSVHGTLIGSISGATSLLAGYCAVTGRVDLLAVLLFIVMAVWQMPHFYAIGIYKKKDYTKASLPILPVTHGIAVTKKHILAYIVLFIMAVTSLTLFGYTGYTYLAAMLIISSLWLRLAVKGFALKDEVKYGHQIFGYSLLALLTFSLAISVDHYLP